VLARREAVSRLPSYAPRRPAVNGVGPQDYLCLSRWTRDGVKSAGSVEGQLYEYACHEGNYGLLGILSGTRAEENKAAEA
jgi:hypothetical protein